MRIITWNLHRANAYSAVWPYLLELKPDIALLQEVGDIPDSIKESFNILSRFAANKNGKPQKFGTAVFVKGMIHEEIELKSEYEWVNRELEYFKGNFVACRIELQNHEVFDVVSVYSPACLWTGTG